MTRENYTDMTKHRQRWESGRKLKPTPRFAAARNRLTIRSDVFSFALNHLHHETEVEIMMSEICNTDYSNCCSVFLTKFPSVNLCEC